MKRLILAMLPLVLIGSQVLISERAVADTFAISIAPSTVKPGGTFTVTGTGWAPGTPVQVCVGNIYFNGPCVNATPDATGAFSQALTIPPTAPVGTYQVTAQQGASLTTATLLVLASGRILATPNPTQPGATVTISGSGFPAGVSVIATSAINLTGGSQQVITSAPATVNASGSFTTTLTVPANADVVTNAVLVYQSGSQIPTTLAQDCSAVQVGTLNGPLACTTLYVQQTAATLQLQPTTVAAGQGAIVALTGTNFLPTDLLAITVTGPSGTIASLSVITSTAGFLTVPIAIPQNVRPGVYTVSVVGINSGSSATAALTITGPPTLSFDPPLVAPGGGTEVTGANFVPNQPVNVVATFTLLGTAGTTSVTSFAVADASGNFSAPLSIPAQAAIGSASVVASQPLGATAQGAVTIVAPSPTPTATSLPTDTPTPAPTETPTATPPPTATPTATRTPRPTPTKTKPSGPQPVQEELGFRYVSVWYRYVKVGSSQHLVVQANHNARIGILATVIMPNGTRYTFPAFTNGRGLWQVSFPVPKNAIKGKNHTVVVQVRIFQGQLHASKTVTFKLVK